MLLQIFLPVLLLALAASLGVLLYSVRKVAGSTGRKSGSRATAHRESGPGRAPNGMSCSALSRSLQRPMLFPAAGLTVVHAHAFLQRPPPFQPVRRRYGPAGLRQKKWTCRIQPA